MKVKNHRAGLPYGSMTGGSRNHNSIEGHQEEITSGCRAPSFRGGTRQGSAAVEMGTVLKRTAPCVNIMVVPPTALLT